MIDLRLKVSLHLAGPILTSATMPGTFALDAMFARNHRNELYLPGTLVKGKLRQAWLELSHALGLDDATIQDWLGQQTGDSSPDRNDYDDSQKGFDPRRARVRLGDLVHGEKGNPAIRTRVAISEKRGSAEEGMLQMAESPFAAGESACFEGLAYFQAADATEAEKFEAALRLGLRAVPSFGAGRGIGFGRLLSVDVSPASATGARPVAISGVGTLRLRLSTADLVCVTTGQPYRNLFESDEVIPGSVLKGALASQLAQLGVDPARGEAKSGPYAALTRHFSQIRFRHARPVAAGTKQIRAAVPLSMVWAKGMLRDVVHMPKPGLVEGEVPAFAPDWKQSDTALQEALQKRFDSPKVDRELRVRTKIDGEKRRAEEAHLFAYDAIVGEGLDWLAEIDLPEGTDRAAIIAGFELALRDGLRGVGKTKARFAVQDAGPVAPQYASHPVQGGRLVIKLESPALLGDPRQLAMVRTPELLLQAYRSHFHSQTKAIVLEYFFARQTLKGGLYQQRRFQNGRQYQPWFLTDAGSVFVFRIDDLAEAQHQVAHWAAAGLPLAPGVIEGYGIGVEAWRDCPYVPENGFGQVSVNQHECWKELWV